MCPSFPHLGMRPTDMGERTREDSRASTADDAFRTNAVWRILPAARGPQVGTAGTKQKARSSRESPGFVVRPRMTNGLRHRHPPGDKAILSLNRFARRVDACDSGRDRIAQIKKLCWLHLRSKKCVVHRQGCESCRIERHMSTAAANLQCRISCKPT